MERNLNFQNKKPELVSPAGDWPSLQSAIKAGADAVYFGIKDLNMRYAASNFDLFEVKKIIDLLHENGKKGYLALNIIVYNNELDKIRKILERARDDGVDAVILWDMAVMSIARELGLKMHLSTQASVSNVSALKFYASCGIERVILARECTLHEIKNIVSQVKKESLRCSVETFIHGSMCASVSGRCFLSHQVFDKSANRGKCIQPCRREYTIIDSENECSYVLGKDYVLSAKDLCTIDFIDKLIEAGIEAFKIEGRMRAAEYVTTVTSAYRKAIDAHAKGQFTKELKESLKRNLDKVHNRSFTNGFYFGKPDDLGGRVQKRYEKIYLGDVVNFYNKVGVAEILIRNESLSAGEEVLIMGKTTPATFAMAREMQIEHKNVEFAKKGSAVGVKLPFKVRPHDKVFLWRQYNEN